MVSQSRMSSYSLKILESLQEENINMRHFLILPTPIFFSGEGKKERKKKIHCISQIEAKLHFNDR